MFLAARTVEPTLDLHAVDGPPVEVFGGDEPLIYAQPLRQAREAGTFAVLTVAHEVDRVEGIVMGADPAAIFGPGQRYEVASCVLSEVSAPFCTSSSEALIPLARPPRRLQVPRSAARRSTRCCGLDLLRANAQTLRPCSTRPASVRFSVGDE